MRHVVGFLQNFTLLLVRIAFGLLLITHAWHRWDQVGMAKEIAYLSEHHIAQPTLLAWGALLLEAVGGLLFVVGLMVPRVAIALVVQNVLTIVWLKWPNGLLGASTGFELNLVQGLLALVFVFYGSGRAGLDAVLFRRRGEDNETLAVRDIP